MCVLSSPESYGLCKVMQCWTECLSRSNMAWHSKGITIQTWTTCWAVDLNIAAWYSRGLKYLHPRRKDGWVLDWYHYQTTSTTPSYPNKLDILFKNQNRTNGDIVMTKMIIKETVVPQPFLCLSVFCSFLFYFKWHIKIPWTRCFLWGFLKIEQNKLRN